MLTSGRGNGQWETATNSVRGFTPTARGLPFTTMRSYAKAWLLRTTPSRIGFCRPCRWWTMRRSSRTSRRCASLFTDVVVEAATPIQHVYFIREGVASVLAEQQDGGSIEVGTIGPEGFIGIPVLLGATSMPYTVVIQVEGEGYRLDTVLFRKIVEERKAVRDLLLRFTHYWTSQLSQSVACNRLHTLDERCARWLLMTHDRVERGTFELTHEFMSLMLGVRRAGVSVAMRQLLEQKIIAYVRGRVRVLDRGRLEEASCRCYQITRAQYQDVLGLGEAG